MSQTVSVEALGPGRWGHMAHIMSSCLDVAIEGRRANPADFPVAALYSAHQFFVFAQSALEEGRVPEDPRAAVTNYAIAADALRASIRPQPTLSDIDQRIAKYAKFIDSLWAERSLDAETLRDAEDVRDFFKELATAGAAEEYESEMKESVEQAEVH